MNDPRGMKLPSLYESRPASSASATAVETASIVTLCSRRRFGSIWIVGISMRSPQIGTFATPGTRIRRVLIFQYVVIDRSIRSRSGSVVVSPIFMTRLVAESGWIMNGGLAHVGSCGEIWEIRSATC